MIMFKRKPCSFICPESMTTQVTHIWFDSNMTHCTLFPICNRTNVIHSLNICRITIERNITANEIMKEDDILTQSVHFGDSNINWPRA